MPARSRKPSPECACLGGPKRCGAPSTYNSAKCGCNPCVKAQAERVSANKARRAAAKVPQTNANEVAPPVASVTTSDVRKALQRQPQTARERRESRFGHWCETHKDWPLRPRTTCNDECRDLLIGEPDA